MQRRIGVVRAPFNQKKLKRHINADPIPTDQINKLEVWTDPISLGRIHSLKETALQLATALGKQAVGAYLEAIRPLTAYVVGLAGHGGIAPKPCPIWRQINLRSIHKEQKRAEQMAADADRLELITKKRRLA